MARHDDDEDDDDRLRGRDRDEEDDDDRPRRRRKHRDDDDYEWERGRKSKDGGGSRIALILGAVFFGLLLVCGVGGYFLYSAVGRLRDAAARTNELNNLKQISLGMINATQTNGTPPRADGDLSWRVHVLPYIEQDNLYRQFDINRPWNQGRNQQLGETVIKTYQCPLDDPPTSQTHYRVFVGQGSPFDTELWRGTVFPAYMKDGTSSTLMLIDTVDPVPWAAPKEVLLQPGGQFPEFGHPKRDLVLTATWDGAVRSVKKGTLDAATIRALATAAGGEAIGDW